MIKKDGIINNVEIFEILNEIVYVGNKESLSIYDKHCNLMEKYDGNISYMLKYKQNILFLIGDKEITYILNNPCKKELRDTTLIGNFIDGDYLYILCSDDSINKYNKNFDLVNTYNVGRFPKLIFQNKFLRTPNKIIFCYDIESNIEFWQHKFSELLPPIQTADDLSQSGNIVVHNGYLYFSLFENNRHLNTATVCIDVETGKVENIFKGFAGNLTLFGDKIGIADRDKIKILNTKTGDIILKDYSTLLGEEKLNMSWCRFIITEDELLYFIADGHGQGTHVGVIDLKSDELLWLYALNPDRETYEVAAMEIKVSGNRLYLHCSDKTLHIFEKE